MSRPLLLAALTAAAVVATAPAYAQSQADREALRALAAEADRAWNVKDADAMAALYAQDASLLFVPRYAKVEGRDAIRAQFQTAFAGRQGNMRHVTTVGDLVFSGPDAVFSDSYVRVEQVNPDGTATLVRWFVNHSLAVRGEDGVWRLKAVRAHQRPLEEARPAG
ncbi:MAG TPA: SgcJ/EcaC family oxidoreductase [Caulobacteraceae bacterium]|nr:SgcJ/EcaC family oxidoreductase [Caulobacteraceae bacterium]